MLNTAIYQGRMVKDVELRETQSGKTVTSFTIANDRPGKDKEKGPNWIDCVAWEGTAEFISKWFKKGSLIIVQGRTETRTYDDGPKRIKATELVVEKVEFCGPRTESEGTQSGGSIDVKTDYKAVEINDDDLPF